MRGWTANAVAFSRSREWSRHRCRLYAGNRKEEHVGYPLKVHAVSCCVLLAHRLNARERWLRLMTLSPRVDKLDTPGRNPDLIVGYLSALTVSAVNKDGDAGDKA